MKRNRIPKRFTIVFCLTAVFSCALHAVYLHTASYRALSEREQAIVAREGNSREKLKLFAVPEELTNTAIGWEEAQRYLSAKTVRLAFVHNGQKRLLGIHYRLTLLFRPYLNSGCLEFWLRERDNRPVEKNLQVFLREGTINRNVVGASVKLQLNDSWTKVVIPLTDFKLIVELDDNPDNNHLEFSWEIKDIAFAIDPLEIENSLELFLSGLRMTNEGKIIYEAL